MCYNPYQYDQLMREAAERSRGVVLPKAEAGPVFGALLARMAAFFAGLRVRLTLIPTGK